MPYLKHGLGFACAFKNVGFSFGYQENSWATVELHGGAEEATFFHRAEWREVIQEAFGHPTWYWLVEDGAGRIRGVPPLVRVRSWLFGDTLASIPFGVYGGVAANGEAARALLEGHACDLARRLGVGALEMRNLDRRHADWPSKDLYVTFRKPVVADHEANLKAVPRKQRAMIRKGIEAGLESVLTQDPDRLYRTYAASDRNLGTPVFPTADSLIGEAGVTIAILPWGSRGLSSWRIRPDVVIDEPALRKRAHVV